MSGLKRLIHEIHRRSLWQVLLIYIGGALLAYEVIQALTEGLGLPAWFPPFAIVLFIIGLPIVLATAFVQEGAGRGAAQPQQFDETEAKGTASATARAGDEGRALRRLFTWRNAIMGGALAFGLWGVVATGWLLLKGGSRADGAESSWVESVAVLPFADMSPEGDQEYFSDGITEELLNRLAKVEGLRVAARTSAFQFKGQSPDVREVGEKLGVEAVLEGSVRKSEERVRITAQLVSAEDGFHLWSETYDRQLADIFAVQEEIARAIVEALKIRLPGGKSTLLVKAPTTDLEAYNLYLKGRFFWNKRTEQTIRTAIEHFQRAVALDSTYALAYAGLADAYVILPLYLSVSPDAASWRSTLERARAAAERALQLDPTLAHAHGALGFVRHLRLDWIGAERAYRRALELDPNYAMAPHWYAITLSASGRLEEALREIRTAQRLDPLSIVINFTFSYLLFAHREYEPAIRQFEATIELDSAFPSPWFALGAVYLKTGRFDDAASVWKRWATLAGRDTLPVVQSVRLAAEHAATGRPALLPAGFEPELPLFDQPAAFYALVGHPEFALSRLEDSYNFYEEGGGWFIWSIKDHPWFDPLRSDPRFIEFLRKIGVQP